MSTFVELDLGAFDRAYAGKTVSIWTDPPQSLRDELQDLIEESRAFLRSALSLLSAGRFDALGPSAATQAHALGRLYALLAQLWSQGESAETHWRSQDIEATYRREPQLFRLLVTITAQLIRKHEQSPKTTAQVLRRIPLPGQNARWN